MTRFLLLILLFAVMGCGTGTPPSQIYIGSLLHDDSSKIWMVESEQINGEEYAPENPNFRTVIIFYKDFTFAEQPLNMIGNRPPKYGAFELAHQNTSIKFIQNSKENVFTVSHFSKKQIVLVSEEKEKDRAVLRLIPLPKL